MQYNQINLLVNGYNILANTLDINESSQQKPIFSFNNNTPYNIVPTDIKSSISLQYFLEPNNEPNYPIITGLIFDKTTPLPSVINIGNIYITGYLNKFSFQLMPNQLVKASADYSIYYPFTGNLAIQGTGDSILYDINNASGLSHYWSAQFLSGGNPPSNNNVLQMEYNVELSMTPIYSLGNPLPTQIFYKNLTESLTILSEQQINTQYSGSLLDNTLNGLQTLNLRNISSVFNNAIIENMYIPLTGFTLQEVKSNITTDSLILFSLNYNRFN